MESHLKSRADNLRAETDLEFRNGLLQFEFTGK
jgi:hypothetical protein